MKFLLSLTLSVCAWGALAQPATNSLNKFAGEYMGTMVSNWTPKSPYGAGCEERLLIDVFVYTNSTVEACVYNYDIDACFYGFGTNTTRGKVYLVFPDAGEAGYVLTGTLSSHKASGTLKPLLPDCKYTFSAQRRWKRPYDPDADAEKKAAAAAPK